MSHEIKRPERGDLLIDARPMGDFLLDAPPGTLIGIRRAQDGFDDVVDEIVTHQPTFGEQAGILQSEVDELCLLKGRIALISQFRPALEKLLEMMNETEAVLDNRCQEIVRNVAKTVDARVATTKDDSLFAHYELTRKYRSAPAKKAVKTRRKKAAAQNEAGENLV